MNKFILFKNTNAINTYLKSHFKRRDFNLNFDEICDHEDIVFFVRDNTQEDINKRIKKESIIESINKFFKHK